jgi:Family of unknown function (DUF6065)
MYKFDVYEIPGAAAILEPLPVKRQWATDLPYPHAYKCFPVTLANQMGYGISFPDDIIFEWDGTNTASSTVKVHAGHKWVYLDRGWGTVSFKTGLIFKTDEDVSMLSYPVPNLFVDGFQIFTTLISTSFFESAWQVAGQITRYNYKIILPARTPVSAVMPISLSQLNESVATKKPFNQLEYQKNTGSDYHNYNTMQQKLGKTTGHYRDGKNHKGVTYGKHEVKSIKLRYNDGNISLDE